MLSLPFHVLVLMACVVESECRGEPPIGQYYVASVMVNRVCSERFPESMQEVLLQSGQFASPANTYSETALRACLLALKKPAHDYLFFFNPNVIPKDHWMHSMENCETLGNHKFCL